VIAIQDTVACHRNQSSQFPQFSLSMINCKRFEQAQLDETIVRASRIRFNLIFPSSDSRMGEQQPPCGLDVRNRALSMPLLYSYEEARHASRISREFCTPSLVHSLVLFMRACTSVRIFCYCCARKRHMVTAWDCYVVTWAEAASLVLDAKQTR
jgi:hypothetical protein